MFAKELAMASTSVAISEEDGESTVVDHLAFVPSEEPPPATAVTTVGTRRGEMKLEEKRARAVEKMRNEVAVAKQKAEKRRAEAEGRRKEKGGKVMEIASFLKI
ncbi:hypothetical protein M5K25_025566 [Dendrobium thyrsiflorum]|uniref:Remorin C-terminal domain-containing protein n=1 Tax=Dendrobium thyrsiflorum TaxID=117978 RepID=A0ABD0U496_DENTH